MKYAPLASLVMLAACAVGPDRATVLNTLVGQRDTEVVRRLGVPTRTYETAGHTFLAYTEQRSQYIAGGPFFIGGGFYGPRYGYAGAFPAEVIQRVCETTFDVQGGVVLSWSLRGNACG